MYHLSKNNISLLLCFLVGLLFFILIKLTGNQYINCLSCVTLFSLSINSPLFNATLDHEEENRKNAALSIWCIQIESRLDNEQYIPIELKLQAPSVNSSRFHRLPYRYSKWKSSPLLPRRITSCEHMLIMHLLMIIERICRLYNLTYMANSGTLLGSWRHHDIIPWDEDADIMVPLQDRSRLLDGFNSLNHTLVAHKQWYIRSGGKRTHEYYKLFFKHTPSAGNYSYNFPYIDIFFYTTNGTHMRIYDIPDTYLVKIEYIFPLVMRPFGELWLPTPNQPQYYFPRNIEISCESNSWNHRKETCISHVWNHGKKRCAGAIKQKCIDLADIYPFVQRENQTGSTIEILKINSSIIHTIVYD